MMTPESTLVASLTNEELFDEMQRRFPHGAFILERQGEQRKPTDTCKPQTFYRVWGNPLWCVGASQMLTNCAVELADEQWEGTST